MVRVGSQRQNGPNKLDKEDLKRGGEGGQGKMGWMMQSNLWEGGGEVMGQNATGGQNRKIVRAGRTIFNFKLFIIHLNVLLKSYIIIFK